MFLFLNGKDRTANSGLYARTFIREHIRTVERSFPRNTDAIGKTIDVAAKGEDIDTGTCTNLNNESSEISTSCKFL